LANVRDVRVLGAIGVVELSGIADIPALKAALVSAGVWVRPFRNIVYLTPAFVISDDELERLAGAIFGAIGASGK
jgi:adenosylmethionine-8-amino-7-oxononanoate aminotransferase